MPSSNPCRAEIEVAIGRALTASENKTIARSGAKLKAAIDGANGNPTAANTILDNFLKEREFIKDAKKMAAAQRELANAILQDRVFASGDFAWKAPGEVLKSFLISSLKVFKGARDSLGWNITTGTAQRGTAFFDDLEQKQLGEYAFSQADQKNQWLAFAALSAGEDASKYGKLASDTAATLKAHTDQIWFDKHAAGIPQGRLQDWAGPQMHDPYTLARAGGNTYGSDASAKAWVSSIMPRLDWSRSFGGQFLAADDSLRSQRLTSLWKQFVAHEHLKYGENFLKNREIHFQSPEDAYNYNAEYGNGRTLAENVFSHIQRGARDIEISKMFGSNPEYMFRKIADGMEKIINDNPDISPSVGKKALEAIKEAKDKAEKYWIPALTDGLANPDHGGVAQYLAATRTGINALAAAGAAPTLLGDIPLAMRVMGEHGGRGMQGYANGLKKSVDWMAALPLAERSRLAASGEIQLQDATSPLTHSHLEWAGFGKINRLQQFLMKYGGHTPWTDRFHMNQLVNFGMSHWADRALSFSDLRPGEQDLFTRYGLGSQEWDVIRQQDPFVLDGGKSSVFTPRNVRQMDLEKFKPLAGADASEGLLRSIRTSVADKYRNLIADVAERSTNAPDAEMRAITLHGTRPGTPAGEIVRNFNSLKSWTYNLMRNHLGASIYGDANPDNVGWGKAMWAFATGQGGNRGGRLGMAKFIANNLVFGSLIVTLADIRDGKQPTFPTSGEEAGELLWRGFARQGLGLYSDLLMSQLDHPEQSPVETVGKLVGPSISDAADLTQAAARVAKSLWNYSTDPDYDSDKFWKSMDRSGAQAGRVGYSLIPGTNFAWSKWATDYYIKDNLLDMLNPGYKDRLLKRAQDQGRPYMMAPQQ